VIVRFLKLGSWAMIGLGALGVLGWAFSVRTISDIGPLGALVFVWLGVLGLAKATRLRNAQLERERVDPRRSHPADPGDRAHA